MGQTQSKNELLYQQVSYGNIEGIKTLHREGAGLEWLDREGKTPLIVSCMNPELYDVAKTLIELGANVNAYRPGRHAGTPLHHAAKRGLESIVKLLLLHGANALVLNDDCQTALEVARAKGHGNVVRAIETHLCLFSGWLREFHGPGFLEVVAPQLVSKKVWVVILPVGSRNLARPYKLELAIYSSMQDAQPRAVISLWKANLEEPKLHQSDPSVTISDPAKKTRLKFAPADENDKEQLKWFAFACKGTPQENPAFLQSNIRTAPPSAPPAAEDPEVAAAIRASIQSSMHERPTIANPLPNFGASSSSGVNTNKHGSIDTPNPNTSDSLPSSKGELVSSPIEPIHINNNEPVSQSSSGMDLIPSAPPIADMNPVDDGAVHYPSIDLSPVDISSPSAEQEQNIDDSGSSCVVCLDAPTEGVCIPCGHVAGCMSCLNEVKAKKWGCPVCRAKIDQVIKIYHV